MSQQRLQLTWYNKDKALIPTETGKYGYRWVEPSDPRYCETHTLVMDEYIQGKQAPKSDDYQYSEYADLEPQTDNLLVHGESGDVLEALTRVPELAEKYVGNVKLVYIDPPFNTAQTFSSYEDNLEHSIWLTMMRDRLLHLKRLLSDDGSIWVHLDTVENHRMLTGGDQGQALGHLAVLDGLDACLLQLVCEVTQFGDLIQLAALSESSGPCVDGSNGVGGGLFTL